MKENVLEAVKDVLGLTDSWQDGTYLHYLTRSKSAYSVGTVTLDDFEEINEELAFEIYEAILPYLKNESN